MSNPSATVSAGTWVPMESRKFMTSLPYNVFQETETSDSKYYLKSNGITVLDTITTYGDTLTVQVASVRLGSSCHTITDDWLRIRREIVDEVWG